eukprot:749183-Hanusia_phi.AAC.2
MFSSSSVSSSRSTAYPHPYVLSSLVKISPQLCEQTVARVTHVCFDECHHLLAESYLKIFDTIRQSPNLTYCLVGPSSRGEDLKKLFKEVLYIDFSWISAKVNAMLICLLVLQVPVPRFLSVRRIPRSPSNVAQRSRWRRFVQDAKSVAIRS